MSSHSFDPDVAKDVGVNAAVLYQNIQFWVSKNEANEKHSYEGRYWMYNSMKAFSRLFIYLSARQIRTALDKLLDKGYIGKGNFNQIGYDRTLWYCDLRQVLLTNMSNGEDGEVSPIPDSKPDNKTDIPPNPKGEKDEIFQKLWKTVLEITPSEIKGRHVKKTSKAKFDKIVSRKEDSISASRIANAVLWYYDQEPQKKEDRKYMKGLTPLLNSEAFSVYLEKGTYHLRTEESDEADAWKMRADYVNQNGGEWPPSAPSPRTMPREHRVLIDKRHWRRFGWEVSQEGSQDDL